MKTFPFLLTLFIVLIGFTACTSDDDSSAVPENEEEVITTVILAVTDQLNATFFYEYKIIDGEPPTVDPIALEENSTYTVDVQFLNENESPVEDITNEIREEAEEHVVCHLPSAALLSSLTTASTDEDDNGKEIGLASVWTTTTASTGELVIVLKHQPGIKEDSATVDCNAGETDVMATFPLQIVA